MTDRPTREAMRGAFMALYCGKGWDCDDPDCGCPHLDILRAYIEGLEAERSQALRMAVDAELERDALRRRIEDRN